MKKSWVYLLLCSDGTFYTGCTTNLEQRINQHMDGTFEGYTKRRRPVKLVWYEEFNDIRNAIDMERRIKKWSSAKKRALIKDNFHLLHALAQSGEMKKRKERNGS